MFNYYFRICFILSVFFSRRMDTPLVNLGILVLCWRCACSYRIVQFLGPSFLFRCYVHLFWSFDYAFHLILPSYFHPFVSVSFDSQNIKIYGSKQFGWGGKCLVKQTNTPWNGKLYHLPINSLRTLPYYRKLSDWHLVRKRAYVSCNE